MKKVWDSVGSEWTLTQVRSGLVFARPDGKGGYIYLQGFEATDGQWMLDEIVDAVFVRDLAKRNAELEKELASCQAVIGGLRVRLDQAERPYFWLGQDVAAPGADKSVLALVKRLEGLKLEWVGFLAIEPKLPRGVRTEWLNPNTPIRAQGTRWMNLGQYAYWTAE